MTNDEWNLWRKQRILEQQRDRRKSNRRIDYYPSEEAAAVIDRLCSNRTGGDYSRVINRLVMMASRCISGIK